ncbi:methyltransferase domain-containing protein [Candidatus Dependentiae bacterium]|nr:methyltransferase domain-containing protein [Candidatus Dependentiae bacterium]
MNENSIRPDELMYKCKILREIDSKNMLKNKTKFVFVNCPACDNTSYSFKFNKEGYSFVECNFCETLFVNPRPNFDLIVDFYKKSKACKYWNTHVFKLSEEKRKKEIFEPRADKVISLCSKYFIDNEFLIDVGAGFGTFATVLKKCNFFKKILLVEPAKSLADTCRNRGLDVIEAPIEDVDLKNVSVVTSFEVIEHLYNPREFILSCKKVLKDKGLLIITTPNIKGFDLNILGHNSDNIFAPEHLNYFNIESIENLLRGCGFKVLETLTPGKLDAEIVRKKILSEEFDVSNIPFMKYLLVDKWHSISKNFQDFIALNNLSSHLWVVAQNVLS